MRFRSTDPRTRFSTDGTSILLEPQVDAFFPAKITGNFAAGGNTYYTWTEQTAKKDATGYEIVTGGRAGTSTSGYAREMNASATVPTNTIVMMRPVTITDNVALTPSTLFEFVVSSGGGGSALNCPHVSSVQCTGGQLVVTYDTTCTAAP
jgi:hypothetical protein